MFNKQFIVIPKISLFSSIFIAGLLLFKLAGFITLSWLCVFAVVFYPVTIILAAAAFVLSAVLLFLIFQLFAWPVRSIITTYRLRKWANQKAKDPEL